MCGLKSKLLCPEFVCLIKQYDIIGIQESKLDDVDNINVQGYQVFTNNRPAISRHRSGGTAILFKMNYLPLSQCTRQKVNSPFGLPFQKRIILSDDELHCGIVYIPPYRSKYAPDDLYLELQNKIDKYAAKSKSVLLFGDFNLRFGINCDFVVCDQYVSKFQGNEEIFQENNSILNCFDSYNIPLKRNSADLTVTFYGQQLLDLCRYNNIFILNGRLGTDKRSPKTTCKDRSIVDFLSRLSIFFCFSKPLKCPTLIICFLMHNVQSALEISLSIDTNHNHNNLKRCQINTPTCASRLWADKITHLLGTNNAECELQNIRANLERVTVQNANQESINNIANQIENIFANSAKQSFGT